MTLCGGQMVLFLLAGVNGGEFCLRKELQSGILRQQEILLHPSAEEENGRHCFVSRRKNDPPFSSRIASEVVTPSLYTNRKGFFYRLAGSAFLSLL